MIGTLLLHDPRDAVRRATAQFIRQKTGTVAEGERYEQVSCFLLVWIGTDFVSSNSAEEVSPTVARFRHFFWPLISRLVKPAVASSGNSAEVLDLCFDMLQSLEEDQPETLQLKELSNEWFSLLLCYTTSEVRRKLPRLHYDSLVRV